MTGLQIPKLNTRVLAAGLTGLAALAVGLSARSTPGPDSRVLVREIARTAGGDFSDRGLENLVARMDPAARSLAGRLDPAARGEPTRLATYLLQPKPDLGLGGLEADAAQRVNAAVPIASDALRPISPFAFAASSDVDRKRALRCLAQAVYYEAALEPRLGQEGVAQVVLNRVRDPNFPSSVCGVVYQGAALDTGCQFSFTCDGSLARPPVQWAWKQAQEVAQAALNGFVATSVGTATHYHADYVFPYWSPTLAKVNQLGRHIFYRWSGQAGDTPAFVQRYAGREPVIDEARFARPRLTESAKLIKASTTTYTTADGTTRVTTTFAPPSMGGRRVASREEIARINASLRQFETVQAAARAPVVLPAATPAPSPAGATQAVPPAPVATPAAG
jgi:spore germination cell wall hydrolase CwlJ-like protein